MIISEVIVKAVEDGKKYEVRLHTHGDDVIGNLFVDGAEIDDEEGEVDGKLTKALHLFLGVEYIQT